jgi:hypothetical protein
MEAGERVLRNPFRFLVKAVILRPHVRDLFFVKVAGQ